MDKNTQNQDWKESLYRIIYEADTPAGKLFDVVLLCAILLSVFAVMLESVESLHSEFTTFFIIIEWIFTVLFTAEYVLRIITAHKPLKYVFSFYGIIDLFSILPTFLSLFVINSSYIRIIRVVRLLRIFRILKLVRYVSAGTNLISALKASRAKIVVFLLGVLAIVVVLGTVMYIIEDADNGFTSIPRSIYWAIVTLTTVGYGDIAPQTIPGQILASLIMIMGYAIIAVPTGIVSNEMFRSNKIVTTKTCHECIKEGHDVDAAFCKFCGSKM